MKIINDSEKNSLQNYSEINFDATYFDNEQLFAFGIIGKLYTLHDEKRSTKYSYETHESLQNISYICEALEYIYDPQSKICEGEKRYDRIEYFSDIVSGIQCVENITKNIDELLIKEYTLVHIKTNNPDRVKDIISNMKYISDRVLIDLIEG